MFNDEEEMPPHKRKRRPAFFEAGAVSGAALADWSARPLQRNLSVYLLDAGRPTAPAVAMEACIRPTDSSLNRRRPALAVSCG